MVGTTLCVGVIAMYHSGIGGGGFMLVRSEDGEYESIDFRETAPKAAYEEMFQGNELGSIVGGLASGVPGELKGLEYLHEKYGVLPWKKAVMPAVKVARDGFPVTEDLHRAMHANFFGEKSFLLEDPVWAEDFAPNGKLLEVGETITRKRLAKTLERVAREGAKVFYEGAIAEDMIQAVQATNGTMTMEDIEEYEISIREPLTIDYRGYRLTSTGAPSSGSVALSSLKIIEGFNMSDPEIEDLNVHRFTESMKHSYAAHNELGDPEFVDGIDKFEKHMLSEKHAKEIRHKISDKQTFNTSHYNPEGVETHESHGTSHIVTADASGLSITLTTTINLFFGSQVMAPKTGIIMNNEMNDFSIPRISNAFGFVPSPANFIRPGKRPLSSITPVIVEYPSGDLYVATGAAGGSRIISATVQALWHVLDHAKTMPEALAMPRLHDQLLPAQVLFEEAFDNRTTAFMKEKGHNVTWTNAVLSSAQGLRRLLNGTFEAAGEPRQMNSGGFAL